MPFGGPHSAWRVVRPCDDAGWGVDLCGVGIRHVPETLWHPPRACMRARLTSHSRQACLGFEGRGGRMQQDTEQVILDLLATRHMLA